MLSNSQNLNRIMIGPSSIVSFFNRRATTNGVRAAYKPLKNIINSDTPSDKASSVATGVYNP